MEIVASAPQMSPPPPLVAGSVACEMVADSLAYKVKAHPFEWASSSFDPEVDLSGAMDQGGATVGGFNYSTDSHPRTFLLTLRFGF